MIRSSANFLWKRLIIEQLLRKPLRAECLVTSKMQKSKNINNFYEKASILKEIGSKCRKS